MSNDSQNALPLEEAQFRSIFESVSTGMAVIGTSGQIHHANPALCRLLGYSSDEIVKLKVSDITHPQDRPETEALYNDLLSGKRQSLAYEKRYLRKDGTTFWGHPLVAMAYDDNRNLSHFVAHVTDISERRQAQKELLAAYRQLQNVIEFLPDATFVIDHEKKVTAWNRAMEEKTGVCKSDVLGQGDYAYGLAMYGERRPVLVDLIDCPDPEIEAQYSYFTKKGETLFAERYLPTLNSGAGGHVWMKASPLYDPDGNLIGAIESIRDITDRKQAEEELKQTNRELDAFVYTASHDLRSPLTPIIGYAQHLSETCRDQLDAQSLECLQKIESQGEKMAALLEDLLTLAKVGYVERPSEPVDLGTVAVEVVSGIVRFRGSDRVVVRANELTPLRVPRMLLYQVLDNLVSNALQYAGLDAGPIEVGGESAGNRVRFYVRDHGPGIPERERDSIFDLFSRGRGGLNCKGTGIGLAIVQKIAKLYGGKAWVEETPGGGSTFWVEMLDG